MEIRYSSANIFALQLFVCLEFFMFPMSVRGLCHSPESPEPRTGNPCLWASTIAVLEGK